MIHVIFGEPAKYEWFWADSGPNGYTYFEILGESCFEVWDGDQRVVHFKLDASEVNYLTFRGSDGVVNLVLNMQDTSALIPGEYTYHVHVASLRGEPEVNESGVLTVTAA